MRNRSIIIFTLGYLLFQFNLYTQTEKSYTYYILNKPNRIFNEVSLNKKGGYINKLFGFKITKIPNEFLLKEAYDRYYYPHKNYQDIYIFIENRKTNERLGFIRISYWNEMLTYGHLIPRELNDLETERNAYLSDDFETPSLILFHAYETNRTKAENIVGASYISPKIWKWYIRNFKVNYEKHRPPHILNKRKDYTTWKGISELYDINIDRLLKANKSDIETEVPWKVIIPLKRL